MPGQNETSVPVLPCRRGKIVRRQKVLDGLPADRNDIWTVLENDLRGTHSERLAPAESKQDESHSEVHRRRCWLEVQEPWQMFSYFHPK